MATIVDPESANDVQPQASGATTAAPRVEGQAVDAITRIATEVHSATREFPHLPPGYRYGLETKPNGIADLRLQSAETRQSYPDTPTNVLVIDLPKQRFKDVSQMRLKVVDDLMTARTLGRVAGPIACLHFVLLGDFIEQVHAEFLSHSDATQTLEQLRNARYDVGYGRGTMVATVAPSTVMIVRDFGKKVSPGDVTIQPSELARIFSRQQGDMIVIDGYEEETVFVAFYRASSVFSLFCSPFYSGTLQQLMWQYGLFVTLAHCDETTMTRVTKARAAGPAAATHQPAHPQPVAAVPDEGSSESDDDNDMALPSYGAELFGQEARGDAAPVVGSDSVELPPELALLLEEASRPAQPATATASSILPDPSQQHMQASRDALTAGFAWQTSAASQHGMPLVPDALSEAESDLVTQLSGASDATALGTVLVESAAVLDTLSPGGKAAVVSALITPPSRFFDAVDNSAAMACVTKANLHTLPIFVGAVRTVTFRKATAGPVSEVFTLLMSVAPQALLDACLVDSQSGNVLAALRGGVFSRNLSRMVDAVPNTPEMVALVTSILCGKPARLLLSTSGGARVLESALHANRIDAAAMLGVVTSRLLASRLPGSTMNLSFPVHLGVASSSIGKDASSDVQLVKALTSMLDRREVVDFLSSVAPRRVHADAIPLIIENLEGGALDSFTPVRRSIVVGFVQRAAMAPRHGAAGEAALISDAFHLIPSWLNDSTKRCTSERSPPFPGLPNGWSVAASASNGLYYFTDKTTRATTYRHPTTGEEYAPMPQAYVWERLLAHKDVLDMARRFGTPGAQPPTGQVVDEWLKDQRHRDQSIDRAVIVALRIRYGEKPPQGADASTRPSAGGAPAAKVHREERRNEVQTDIAESFAAYPAVGDPFPAVGAEYQVKVSASNGHFYFVSKDARTGKEASSYKHPSDGGYYPVAPQYFVRRSEVPLDVFAKDFGLEIEALEKWFADQRLRDPAIDDAAMQAFEVKYKARKPKKSEASAKEGATV